MKNRALALLLCLALLASLAGCFRIVPKAPEAAPAAEPAPAEAETEPAAPALPAEPEEAAEVETPPAESEEPAEAGGPEEAEEPAEPETPPEETGPRYFREVWHGDADYSDLSYEHYEAARFDELTEPIYALARQRQCGGLCRGGRGAAGRTDLYLHPADPGGSLLLRRSLRR